MLSASGYCLITQMFQFVRCWLFSGFKLMLKLKLEAMTKILNCKQACDALGVADLTLAGRSVKNSNLRGIALAGS